MHIAPIAFAICLASTTVLAEPSPSPKDKKPMTTVATYTVTYSAGPQWKPNEPMERQDLAGHMGYVKRLFAQHTLLAYGHLVTGQGFYVFAVPDARRLDAIIAADPGIDAGVLRVDRGAPWTLAMEQLGAPTKSRLYVVDYRPGPHWRSGRSLGEQPLDTHLKYVGAAYAEGRLLAGGVVDAHHGRYIVAAADRAAAEAWTKADPAVRDDVLRPEITEWTPFERQSVR